MLHVMEINIMSLVVMIIQMVILKDVLSKGRLKNSLKRGFISMLSKLMIITQKRCSKFWMIIIKRKWDSLSISQTLDIQLSNSTFSWLKPFLKLWHSPRVLQERTQTWWTSFWIWPTRGNFRSSTLLFIKSLVKRHSGNFLAVATDLNSRKTS